MSLSQAMLVFVVLAPGVVFGVFGAAVAARLGSGGARSFQDHGSDVFRLCIRRCVTFVWSLASTGPPAVTVTFGNWFAVHDYRFPAGADGGPAVSAVPGA